MPGNFGRPPKSKESESESRDMETKAKSSSSRSSQMKDHSYYHENDEDEDDGPVCHICLDGSNYENNDIILCDKCDVAVHQMCYGVTNIPEGDWYCYVCASGGDPSKISCVLCNNYGGAYKPTNIPNVWAHGICSTWIPEIFATDESGKTLNISHLDKQRTKLKCNICAVKEGSCIQCAYGRCTTAVHPWCCMFNPQGFKHRIVKDENDNTVWEIFCRAHANAVSEPVKPKIKAKQSHPIPMQNSEDKLPTKTQDGDLESKMDKLDMKDYALDRILNGRKNAKIVDDDSSIESRSMAYPSNGHVRGKGKAPKETQNKTKITSSQNQRSFPVYTLSEWPGILEGDGLDLDHFWNYSSMSFPEEHPSEWLQYMFDQIKESCVALEANFDAVKSRPVADMIFSDEGDLSAIADKDRQTVYDSIKRNHLLNSVYHDLYTLNGSIGITDNGITYIDEATKMSNEETEFLCSSHNDDSNNPSDYKKEDIRVAFDSDSRYVAKYKFRIGKSETPSDILNEESSQWINQHVIGLSGTDLSNPSDFQASLESYDLIPHSQQVMLSNGGVVIPKDDDNVVNRMLMSDQLAYARLVSKIKEVISKMISNEEFINSAGENLLKRKTDVDLENLYLKQRIWRRVARAFYFGVRDQGEDFNRQELDNIPASWRIKVDGRPDVTAVDGEEPEVAEDAICMCCFDGSSSEGNRILFCDGCNATVHQACYGISEIPEGDFYCDRCKEVQYAYRNMRLGYGRQDIARCVTCALCPVQHGGLKPTTDGRWVHVCCAIWSRAARINDLTEMSPIDITEVPMQQSFGNHRRDADVTNPYNFPCHVCKVYGGFVVQCRGCNDSSMKCYLSFHPLCAWFEGIYITTTITDPSFQGKDRDGFFPSGLSFQFYCVQHSSKDHKADISQAEYHSVLQLRQTQKLLRQKYMMKREDLECLPGQHKRKRSRPKPKRDPSTSASTDVSRMARGAQQSEAKELSIDTYDNKICAICMTPTDSLMDSTAWSKFKCIEIHSTIIPPNENPLILANNSSDDTSPFQTKQDESVVELGVMQETNIDESDAVGDKEELKADQSSRLIAEDPLTSKDISDSKSGNDDLAAAELLLSAAAQVASSTNESNYNDTKPPENATDESQHIHTCDSCGMTVHHKCLQNLASFYLPVMSNSKWRCDSCQQEKTNIACVICPRRGGYFLNTSDGHYVHYYCAKYTSINLKLTKAAFDPTDPSIITFPMVDILSSLKDRKAKHKCVLCNRKYGVCEQCHFTGCMSYFHPLCAERSGGGYVQIRSGTKVYFCSEHIPEGTERVTYRSSTLQGAPIVSRQWINSSEMQRLRYVMVRSLTVLDSLVRREKYKRLLCKADGEFYSMRIQRLLDKIKGRKVDPLSGVDVGELFDDSASEDQGFMGDDADYMSDAGDNNKDHIQAEVVKGQRSSRRKKSERVLVPTEQSSVDDWEPIKLSTGTDILLPISEDEEAGTIAISSNWHDGSTVILPSKIFIHIGGYEFDRRETLVEGGSKAFLRVFKERMMNVAQMSREACGVFSTASQASEFSRKLSPYILRHLSMSLDEFKAAMEKEGLSYENPIVRSNRQTPKPKTNRVKPGYVVLDSDDEFVERIGEFDRDFETPMLTKRISKKPFDEEHWTSSDRRRKQSKLKRHLEDEKLVDDNSIDQYEKIDRRRRPRQSVDIHPSDHMENGSDVDKGDTGGIYPDNEDEEESGHQPAKKSKLSTSSPLTSYKYMESVTNGSTQTEYFEVSPDAISTTAASQAATSSSSGPWFPRNQLLHALQNDPIMSAIVTIIGNSDEQRSNTMTMDGMMDDIYALSGFKIHTDNSHESTSNQQGEGSQDDWFVYNNHLLPQLERRLQDIIRVIESYEVPDDFSHGRRGRKKSVSKHRQLCEDFSDIPEESFPEYSFYVRHILTLEILKSQLQTHHFRSMSAFSKSFYEMINNARAVTPINCKTWKDSEDLVQLFEDTKVSSLTADVSTKNSKYMISSRKRSEVTEAGEYFDILCCECEEMYAVSNWPEGFQVDDKPKSKPRKSTQKSLSNHALWICGSCVTSLGANIIGRRVRVWWHDDAMFYTGLLDAMDCVTGKSRVLYDDGEWEFISLSTEPVLCISET